MDKIVSDHTAVQGTADGTSPRAAVQEASSDAARVAATVPDAPPAGTAVESTAVPNRQALERAVLTGITTLGHKIDVKAVTIYADRSRADNALAQLTDAIVEAVLPVVAPHAVEGNAS